MPRSLATSIRAVALHLVEWKACEVLCGEILLENPVQQPDVMFLWCHQDAELVLAEFKDASGPILGLTSGKFKIVAEVFAQKLRRTLIRKDDGVGFLVNAISKLLDSMPDAARTRRRLIDPLHCCLSTAARLVFQQCLYEFLKGGKPTTRKDMPRQS